MMGVVVFGVSGSLGRQCLEVVREHHDCFRFVGGSVGSDRVFLSGLRDEFPESVFFLSTSTNPSSEGLARSRVDLLQLDVDTVIFAEGGVECRDALLQAVAMKKRILIANKELLVSFGEDIAYLARELQVPLLPLDSELCGVFQALQGEHQKSLKRLFLTASGGALRDREWADLGSVIPDEVLKHPNWKMGKKITVDSATMVNKAFEVIEAHHLFDIPYECIEVRLHPQSLVHAIVEFEDGFSKAVVSPPDMKSCIRYCLFYPQRASIFEAFGFGFDRDLHFSPLVPSRYPCFDLVVEIARKNPELLPELVRADEEAVRDFMDGRISYHQIYDRLLEVTRNSRSVRLPDVSLFSDQFVS